MKHVRTWTKWGFWSFGVYRYATTVSSNMQVSIGPFRFEFEKQTSPAPSISFGQMRRESSGAWQGKKKMEKIYGSVKP